MSTGQDLNSELRVDLLKHMELIQREELKYRRELQYKIFAWSNSIFLLLIGALLVTNPSENAVWLSFGFWGKLVASATVLLTVVFSLQWQNRNRKLHVDTAGVIKRIDCLLHYFDKGYFDPQKEITIFPQHWSDYGEEKVNIKTRLGTINYASATTMLGGLAIAMVWLS